MIKNEPKENEPVPVPELHRESEDTLATAGQRRVNLMWEGTQATIAILITSAVIFNAIQEVQSEVLTNAFFLIVSMYFVRTNHTRTGGVLPGQER